MTLSVAEEHAATARDCPEVLEMLQREMVTLWLW